MNKITPVEMEPAHRQMVAALDMFSRELAEAQEWAIARFLEEHPDLTAQDIEIVSLEGNIFSYYVRKRKD